MSVTVRCQSCKTENELTRIFCTECGVKLDHSKITAKGLNREKSSGQFLKVIRFLFSVSLIAVLGLMVWPVQGSGQKGDRDQAVSFKKKSSALREATNQGQPLSLEISEAEINAYITQRLREGALSETVQGPLRYKKLNMAIDGEKLTLVLACGWGPVPLTFEVRGDAAVNKSVTYNVSSSRLGHVPLPEALRKRAVNHVGVALQAFLDEQSLLEKLAVPSWGDGVLSVQTVPAP